ncbi:MAG TPA: aminotransferase class V-fold PLP-dependent enzyme [Gemmatimonadaceae bacterium]|jgi:selenocysteine lyase/cysteine desulfurase|nr:aminotransferase class V-fold PLP-dependent enzyme [Gemmatimonadaceae bacterium]
MLTDDTTYFAALRAREFSRLDAAGCAYLDYTGSGLYAESLIRADTHRLLHSVSGNPHSDACMAECIERTRADVLAWLDADPRDYTVIFTANATAALRLVGESYPFTSLTLSADNHNSVNGLRRFARRRGATVRYLPLNDQLRLDDEPTGQGLFAYPAQSNFSGVQHPLSWPSEGEVLLDAAAFVPTNALSLRACKATFVVVSFYKMFGYPTGVGALIVRHDALKRLKRPWFSGGTVERVWVSQRRHKLKAGPEGFEDGTPNFLALAALGSGLAFMREVGIERLHRRVSQLGALLRERLADNPRIHFYGPTETQGGVVTFNVEGVSFESVERAARDANIAIRSGCFCNPGAAEHAFATDGAVGAVRASVGVASTEQDILRLVSVLGDLP